MQIFPRTLNLLPLVAALALAVGGGVVTFVVAYYFSPWNTQVGYAPTQPVPFSHRLHAGELGMDCRYCHANVERSYEAMVPPTQTCMGCHARMNTLGYPFEIYNHAGFVRATDHGGAPNGQSTITNAPDPALNGPVANAVELSEKLASSPHAKRCFLRQAFRYFMGRHETYADACTLNAMEVAYDQQGSFISAVKALTNSDAFLYRRRTP